MNLLEFFKEKSSGTNWKELEEGQYVHHLYPKEKSVGLGYNSEGIPIFIFDLKKSENFPLNIRSGNFDLEFDNDSPNTRWTNEDGDVAKFKHFAKLSYTGGPGVLRDEFIKLCEDIVLNYERDAVKLINLINDKLAFYTELPIPGLTKVQGCWAELLVIYFAKDIENAFEIWHNSLDTTYDFESDNLLIEVKSTQNIKRIHHFRRNQLIPRDNKALFIASVKTTRELDGLNIEELLEKVCSRCTKESREKLREAVMLEMKNTPLSFLSHYRFDFESALSSIRYYCSESMEKIESSSIPNAIDKIEFTYDMSNVEFFSREKLIEKSIDLNDFIPDSYNC